MNPRLTNRRHLTYRPNTRQHGPKVEFSVEYWSSKQGSEIIRFQGSAAAGDWIMRCRTYRRVSYCFEVKRSVVYLFV